MKSSEKVQLKTWSTISVNAFDAPNDGKYLIGFEVLLPGNSSAKFEVSLIPSNQEIACFECLSDCTLSDIASK